MRKVTLQFTLTSPEFCFAPFLCGEVTTRLYLDRLFTPTPDSNILQPSDARRGTKKMAPSPTWGDRMDSERPVEAMRQAGGSVMEHDWAIVTLEQCMEELNNKMAQSELVCSDTPKDLM